MAEFAIGGVLQIYKKVAAFTKTGDAKNGKSSAI